MVSMLGWSHWSPFEHGWSQRGVVAFSTGRFDCRRPRMLWLPKVLFPHVADVLLHSLFEWFLNLKKCKKKENTWNIKKQTFKTEKKNGSKRNGEKKERQKGKNIGTTWTCPFAFFQAKSKKQNKSKQKANRKRQNQCKWTSSFFPLFDFPFFPLDCSFICFCVFWILLMCCLFPFFLHLIDFFSSLLILRISYGLVKIILCSPKAVGISPIVTTVVL